MRPLKVLFDGVNWSSNSGPNTFAHRLATQLTYDGHVIADKEDYDVALVFIEPTQQFAPGKPLVQRLDGIWFKPQDFERRNRSIREFYRVADHVVFQSDFDRGMVTHWWGDPKAHSVVGNGIELKQREVPQMMQRLRKDFDKVFVCSANWHPQKRLYDNIELFKHIRANFEPRSCLVVLGSNPDVIAADPGIFYAGSKPHETCLELYAFADWMIHLAWLDHCPNVVVEALSQGLPVICSSEGGTAALVGPDGLVLEDTQTYNYELTDYDSPPRIDVTQLDVFPPLRPKVDPSRLDIALTSKRYAEIMKGLVG